MAIMVTLDAETAAKFGLEDGAQISMADYEAYEERQRAARKLQIAVDKYNDNKAQRVRRARLLSEANAAAPEILADLLERVPDGFVLTNQEDLENASQLVEASAVSPAETDSKDEQETPANSGRRTRQNA